MALQSKPDKEQEKEKKIYPRHMAESEVALYTVVHCAIYGTTSLENGNTCNADTDFKVKIKVISDLKCENQLCQICGIWESIYERSQACKPVLKLNFSAHDILESLPEFFFTRVRKLTFMS